MAEEKKSRLTRLRVVEDELLPEWMKNLPEEERLKYLEAPNCKICHLRTPQGYPLRHEVELLVIEDKSYKEIGKIMYARYGVKILPSNISFHMNRHAPNFMQVVQRIISSELGDMLAGSIEGAVDQYKVLMAIMQVGLHGVLEHPEKVTTRDTIAAAEKFHVITEGLDIRHHNEITQAEINEVLDIMQNIMSPEQIEEARRRFVMMREHLGQQADVEIDDSYSIIDVEPEALPEPEPQSPIPEAPPPEVFIPVEQAPQQPDPRKTVIIDGQEIDVSNIPILEDLDDEQGDQID